MAFKDKFAKTMETRDHAPEPELRTRYYRERYDVACEKVSYMLKSQRCNVTSIDIKRGEIAFNHGSYLGSAIVTKISPFEVAVDFVVNTTGFFSWGRPKKIIKVFYEQLDNMLTRK